MKDVLTKLDILNSFLRRDGELLKLPEFRRTVSPSFSNLDWLKKTLPKNKDTKVEILQLLKLSQKELLKPVEVK